MTGRRWSEVKAEAVTPRPPADRNQMMRRALHIPIFAASGLAVVLAASTSVSAAPARPTSTSVSYGGPISYAQVMLRAADWLRRDIRYSQSNRQAVWDVNRGRRYRADCSGFVSMAWAIDPRDLGRAPVTWELPSYATRIRWRDLRSGDILLNLVPANRSREHVRLFGRWVDPAHTTARVYEESGRAHGVRGILIFSVASARAGYVPYRYRRIY